LAVLFRAYSSSLLFSMKKLFTLALLLPLGAWAQAPTLLTAQPARNAVSASPTAPFTLNFSTAVTGVGDLRLTGSLWRGSRAGFGTGDGTTTLVWQPQRAFAPGEQLSLTVPATVRAAGTGGAPLASGQVLQFRAAAGPATGTFTTGVRQNTLTSMTAMRTPQLADLNNDGRLDYIFLESNGAFFYLGDGQGGFGSQNYVNLGMVTSTGGLTVADMNADGNLDLVVRAYDGQYIVRVLLGNGQGRFTILTSFTAYYYEPAPLVGDVNADGYPDIVFTDMDAPAPNTTNDVLKVRLGGAGNTFSSLPDIIIQSGTTSQGQLIDTNNDGTLDCVLGGGAKVQTYLGNGAGSFAAAPGAALTTGNFSSIADFTGDGVPDLVQVRSTDEVRVYAGTGTGTFTATPLATLAVRSPKAATPADVDGDGDLDIVIARNSLVFSPSATQSVGVVWLNTGAGSFTPGSSVPRNTTSGDDNFPTALAAGDLNNDGALDLVLADTHGNFAGSAFDVRLNTALATAPIISSFTPAFAAAGTTVAVTGSNLTGATAVTVGGVPVGGFTVNAGTITFTMPTGSAGGLVSITTPTGTATSTTALLTMPAPLISGFTPTFAAPGTTVTVSGSNLTGVTAVSVGGVPVIDFTVNSGTVSFVMTNSLPGGFITVTTPGGTATSATSLGVPPAITSFSPTSARVRDYVYITGVNLANATAVTVGGVAVPFTVMVGTGQLIFMVPAGLNGGLIAVTTPGGTVTSTIPLILPPDVTGFSPASAPVGAIVTVTGVNLANTTSVQVGTTVSTSFTFNPATGNLSFVVPPGATTGSIVVISPTTTVLSPTQLTIVLPPAITSFTPTSVPAGTATITVTGSNLTGATAVTVGGMAAGNVVVTAGGTALSFTLPAGSTGGLIAVTTPGGTVTSTTALAVVPPSPTITSFSPATAPASAPVTVTVTGTNLSGATAVSVGGVSISSFAVDPTSGVLTFTLPAGSAGGTITVTTLGGTATSTTALVLIPAPTITSFTPTSAPAGQPTTIVVTGTNLSGATVLTVGGVAVTGFTVDPAGATLSFTLPAGSAGGRIAITTPSGTVTSTTALTIVLGTRTVATLPVQLYPNPTHSTVYVNQPAGAATPLQAGLYNPLGQLVRTAVLPAAASALDVSGLAPGIYTLRLTAGAAGATHRITVE
jgi:hypothetical protein